MRLRLHGIDQVDVDINHELTDEQDRGLYVIERAVHECVSNIIRHSHATSVYLALECNADYFRLRVEDNGEGDNLELSINGEGQGLKNIRARLSTVNGQLDVDTQPGKGFRAILEIPRSAISTPDDASNTAESDILLETT